MSHFVRSSHPLWLAVLAVAGGQKTRIVPEVGAARRGQLTVLSTSEFDFESNRRHGFL